MLDLCVMARGLSAVWSQSGCVCPARAKEAAKVANCGYPSREKQSLPICSIASSWSSQIHVKVTSERDSALLQETKLRSKIAADG